MDKDGQKILIHASPVEWGVNSIWSELSEEDSVYLKNSLGVGFKWKSVFVQDVILDEPDDSPDPAAELAKEKLKLEAKLQSDLMKIKMEAEEAAFQKWLDENE